LGGPPTEANSPLILLFAICPQGFGPPRPFLSRFLPPKFARPPHSFPRGRRLLNFFSLSPDSSEQIVSIRSFSFGAVFRRTRQSRSFFTCYYKRPFELPSPCQTGPQFHVHRPFSYRLISEFRSLSEKAPPTQLRAFPPSRPLLFKSASSVSFVTAFTQLFSDVSFFTTIEDSLPPGEPLRTPDF